MLSEPIVQSWFASDNFSLTFIFASTTNKTSILYEFDETLNDFEQLFCTSWYSGTAIHSARFFEWINVAALGRSDHMTNCPFAG